MGHSETFEHTADLGLRVRGRSGRPVRAAAAGLFDNIVANRADVRPVATETVSLAARSVAELFLAWLNELIFRSETGHRLYSQFRVHRGHPGPRLDAEIAGEPIDRDRHVLDHEVKAATHHGLTVDSDADGWLAEVILDI